MKTPPISLPYCHIYGQLVQTEDRLSDELNHMFGLGLTCDTSVSFAQARTHRDTLAELQRKGGLVAPNIYPVDFNEKCRDSNWWKYSEDECFAFLKEASARFAELNMGPLLAVNTYTPGNTFVAACRRAKIRYLLGFCAPTVGEDSGWELSHYGSPLSPFFVSEEDYRKPENPGQRSDPLLIANMELRNPMVCLNHWNEGPWCPLNALAADRTLEPSGDPLPFLQIAEDWLRESELTGNPLFFNINLQYFFTGRCFEHNRRALEWLADQRDKGRLAIGGLRAWEEQLVANGGFKRQTTYWRGEMMGFHVGHRPGCFPDVIVDENLDRQSIWQAPDPLPRRFYDYQKSWNYPAFEPTGAAPASTGFQGVEVRVESIAPHEPGKFVEINNSHAPRRLSLALWNVLDGWEGPWEVEVKTEGWTAQVVPHPSGSGGAVILEGWAAAGRSRVELRAKGAQLAEHLHYRQWGQLVAAQTFFHHGRPYTLLAAQTPEPFTLMAKIRRDPQDREPMIVEHLLGIDHGSSTVQDDQCVLRFDGMRLASWQRIWGVRADQIELIGVEATEARLRCEIKELTSKVTPGIAVPAPGYQLFGNIRDASRWDRAVGRAAGEVEVRRMNDWFRQQRAGVGEVVIEVHPGVYLPRGSITKVLGSEFDVKTCAPDYGFKELCVDYPQGWDWGVAAWVQWRHLHLRLDGLNQQKGTYLLHLHAFDPEGRDTCQQVYFYNPQATAAAPLFEHLPIYQEAALCGVTEWALPRGIEGRWDPSALCSVVIPEACLAWPSVEVRIIPKEKLKLYDWIGERGAPGVISHLWVTRAE